MSGAEPPSPYTQLALRMIPRVGDALAQFNVDLHERRKARVDKLRMATEEQVPSDALFAAIQNDEEVAEQFRRAVQAACESTSDAKIELLGRALACGVLAEDDSQIEIAGELLRLATELEAPDIRALMTLDRHADHLRRGGNQPEFQDVEQVLINCGWPSVLTSPVVARLQRLGLLRVERDATIAFPDNNEDDEVDLHEAWTFTAAARELLRLLAAAATGQVSNQ